MGLSHTWAVIMQCETQFIMCIKLLCSYIHAKRRTAWLPSIYGATHHDIYNLGGLQILWILKQWYGIGPSIEVVKKGVDMYQSCTHAGTPPILETKQPLRSRKIWVKSLIQTFSRHGMLTECYWTQPYIPVVRVLYTCFLFKISSPASFICTE